ncbi:MAG: hypothetical protein ABIS51_18405 [Sphingomonas sp.]
MDESQVAKLIADTLNWAVGQANCPSICNLEVQEGGVILFDTIEGESFSMTIENIDL